jgi:hypothetical protein
MVLMKSFDEKHPKIHGNHLVWVSGRGADQEIYLGITRLLSPVSPGDGFAFTKKSYPVFEWEAIGYDRFRVEFSSAEDFTAETITFPLLSGSWFDEPSFTVEDKEKPEGKSLARLLDSMKKTLNSLYWRIVAQDQYGNETTSQVRRIVSVWK